jgi:hypothetical protein
MRKPGFLNVFSLMKLPGARKPEKLFIWEEPVSCDFCGLGRAFVSS